MTNQTMSRFAICFMALFALASCALGPQGVPPQKALEIKTIAIVPAVPETVSLSYTGLTVFNNTFYSVPIDWHLQDVARVQLEKSLGERYRIVPFAYDAADFFEIKNGKLLNTKDSDANVRAAVPSGLADAVLVVVAHNTAAVSSNRGALTKVSLYYVMKLYDGRTLERIGTAVAGLPCGPGAICLQGLKAAEKETNFVWGGGDPNVFFRSYVREETQSVATALWSESIPDSLRRLGLIATQP